MADAQKRTSSSRRNNGSRDRGRSWSPQMYMNPGGDTPGFSYGVLRRTYRGEACNISAAEFVRRKLYPVDAPPAGQWSSVFTCSRWDVLLPPSACDDYLSPGRLLKDYERHLLPWRQGLLCSIKVLQPVTEPLQASYERIRCAARIATLRRNLPVVLCAHAPFMAGVDSRLRQPHVHVLILASELSLLGWGPPNDEVTSDGGHLTLYHEFRAAEAIA